MPADKNVKKILPVIPPPTVTANTLRKSNLNRTTAVETPIFPKKHEAKNTDKIFQNSPIFNFGKYCLMVSKKQINFVNSMEGYKRQTNF